MKLAIRLLATLLAVVAVAGEQSPYDKALELYDEGPSKAPEIIKLLKLELAANPDNYSAMGLLGITFFGIGEFNSAVEQFDSALDTAAEEGKIPHRLLFYKARTLHQLGRDEEAKHILEVFWAFWQGDDDLLAQSEQLYAAVSGLPYSRYFRDGIYACDDFGVTASIPDDWKLYREEVHNGRLRVAFGLPMTWSELEQQEIENAVSIIAYRREDVKSLEDLVRVESLRIEDILVSREDVESELGRAVLDVTRIEGLEYRSITTYHFVNGIGYALGFTATAGTFDLNIDKYKRFLSTLTFGQLQDAAE